MIACFFPSGFIITWPWAEGCSSTGVKILPTGFTAIVVILAVAERFRVMAPPSHSTRVWTETLLPAFIADHRLMTLFTAKRLLILPLPVEKLLDGFSSGSNLLPDFFVDSAFSKKPQRFGFLRFSHWHFLQCCFWLKKQPRYASVVAIQPRFCPKVKRLREELSESSETWRGELKHSVECYHRKWRCYHRNWKCYHHPKSNT